MRCEVFYLVWCDVLGCLHNWVRCDVPNLSTIWCFRSVTSTISGSVMIFPVRYFIQYLCCFVMVSLSLMCNLRMLLCGVCSLLICFVIFSDHWQARSQLTDQHSRRGPGVRHYVLHAAWHQFFTLLENRRTVGHEPCRHCSSGWWAAVLPVRWGNNRTNYPLKCAEHQFLACLKEHSWDHFYFLLLLITLKIYTDRSLIYR